MSRYQGEEAPLAAKTALGVLMSVFSAVSLLALTSLSEKIMQQPMPRGLWWGIVGILSVLLLVGAVWAVTGIRAALLPTSMLYQITDPTRLFERLRPGRRRGASIR